MKRYEILLISLLLTLGVLYLIRGVFISKEITVTADIEAEKPFMAQIFYTEDEGEIFNAPHSVTEPVPAGKSMLKVSLPTKHINGFRFDFGIRPGTVTLRNLKLNGYGTFFFDFDNFLYNQYIENYDINGGKLTITSDKHDPYMAWRPALDFSAGHQVDWCRLVILGSFFAFVFSKALLFLSKFTFLEKQPISDIVLVGLFFILAFIPMLYISDAEKSEQENRTLAKMPQLVLTDGVINNTYGSKFNDWFSDRFLGRDMILSSYKKGMNKVAFNKGTEKILIGKNGWVFTKVDGSIDNYANKTVLSEERLKQGLAYLKAIDEWCQKNGKKFYYFIAPDKNRIYPENYPDYIHKIRSDKFAIGKQFAEYIRKNSNVKVIYPDEELIHRKDEGLLYYRGGTHWNYLGAYYGYKELLKAIQKDFPVSEIEVLRWDHEKKASDQDLLKMVDRIDENTDYQLPIYRSEESCQVQNKYNHSTGEISCSTSTKKYKAFVLRDSFFILPKAYLSNTFNQTKYLWKNKFEKEDLEDIKANYDIVILENVERYIPRILLQAFPEGMN